MIIIETCPECGHDLIDIVLASNPPIPRKCCFSCGWQWTGEPKKVERIPFGGNINIKSNFGCDFSLNSLLKKENPCDKCPTNIKNGGDGICYCTLGTPVVN